MEVASPLPFNHVQTGNKRRFECSSIVDASAMGIEAQSDDYAMDDNSGYSHSFKRRRFGSSEHIETNQSSNMLSTTSFVSKPFGNGNVLNSMRNSVLSSKRQRSEENHAKSCSEKQFMQQTIERQTADIQRLTSEKSSVLNSYNELKINHEKIVNENKILKRAVTIQQERQNQAASELDAARKYKGDAEEKMRKLEQIVLSLRYHLQAQQSCSGNDFLGLNQHQPPPDVF